MDWLDQMITTIATRTGNDASAYSLDAGVRHTILDLARIASHSSGNRINAPLLCYVLGMMNARGVALDEAAVIVREHDPSGHEQ